MPAGASCGDYTREIVVNNVVAKPTKKSRELAARRLTALDVDREDHALAMMGFYEACDVSMAVDLFDWMYRRSQTKYKVVSESLGSLDLFRIKCREAFNEAVGRVVRSRQPMADAVATLGLPDEDAPKFEQLLAQELNVLKIFNCARHRLGMKETQAWIDEGRPSAYAADKTLFLNNNNERLILL